MEYVSLFLLHRQRVKITIPLDDYCDVNNEDGNDKRNEVKLGKSFGQTVFNGNITQGHTPHHLNIITSRSIHINKRIFFVERWKTYDRKIIPVGNKKYHHHQVFQINKNTRSM